VESFELLPGSNREEGSGGREKDGRFIKKTVYFDHQEPHRLPKEKTAEESAGDLGSQRKK